MTAYRRVYDSRHLQADCQEPGSAPERSVIEYGLALPSYRILCRTPNNVHVYSSKQQTIHRERETAIQETKIVK